MAVAPTEGERYYIRLLLSHVTSACSFEELRTVEGHFCTTFREACLLKGLLQDDEHYVTCFEEVVTYRMSSQLRQLFVVILALCSPHDPKSIWLKFKDEMSSDFFSRGITHDDSERETIKALQHMLELIGEDINDYSLVPNRIHVGVAERSIRIITDERNLPILEDNLFVVAMLNDAQKMIFSKVMQCVNDKSPILLFVDGPGGTGKTYLYRALLAQVRSQNLIALATASSGVAAGILPGGRTAHYRFKIQLEVHESMQCNVVKQSGLAALLKLATLIIWDKAPMMHKYCIESVDRLLRDLNNSTLPFGGKLFFLEGILDRSYLP